MWKCFLTATGQHWDTLYNLLWWFSGGLSSIWQHCATHTKKSGRRARHRVFWVRALTVCSEIWTGQQLCFSVPDWSPEVFGLAQLSVWSGCFWDTDWPALKPNTSLSSKTLFLFSSVPAVPPIYWHDFQSFAQLCLFWRLIGACGLLHLT